MLPEIKKKYWQKFSLGFWKELQFTFHYFILPPSQSC